MRTLADRSQCTGMPFIISSTSQSFHQLFCPLSIIEFLLRRIKHFRIVNDILKRAHPGRRAREIPYGLTSARTSSLPARSPILQNPPSRQRPTTSVLRHGGGISSVWKAIRWNAPFSESLLLNIPKVRRDIFYSDDAEHIYFVEVA